MVCVTRTAEDNVYPGAVAENLRIAEKQDAACVHRDPGAVQQRSRLIDQGCGAGTQQEAVAGIAFCPDIPEPGGDGPSGWRELDAVDVIRDVSVVDGQGGRGGIGNKDAISTSSRVEAENIAMLNNQAAAGNVIDSVCPGSEAVDLDIAQGDDSAGRIDEDAEGPGRQHACHLPAAAIDRDRLGDRH